MPLLAAVAVSFLLLGVALAIMLMRLVMPR